MKSMKIYIKRITGKMIPFEYNYFLGIAFLRKLIYFQGKNLRLHSSSQIGIYTFSNIISPYHKKLGQPADNGLDIESGYIFFRTLNESLSNYLRLGILEDPTIKIKDTTYQVSRIEDIKPPSIEKQELKFKTLSPVLVRDYSKKNFYVNKEVNVPVNLKAIMENQLTKFFSIHQPTLNFSNLNLKRKTIRISSNGKKESITTGFNLTGVISGTPEILKILYYKGLGSKTSLGLGCWEVVE